MASSQIVSCSIKLVFIMMLCHVGESVRTSQKIYINIHQIGACFRRLNATHQIGCSSSMKGDIGVIHYLETEEDFKWIINYGPHAPYIVFMSSVNFNITNVQRLKASGKVSGILLSHVLNNDTITPLPSGGFSPDLSCPLDAYGMYNRNPEYQHCKSVTWNPVGNGLMYEDIGIPVFIILSQSEVQTVIRDCYEKFNKPNENGSARDYPLCSAELKSAMYAAKDSVTCIRRTNHVTNLNPDTFCEPMGDENVFVTVKEINSTQTLPENHMVIAAARIDSFSLFNGTTPSADNDVTGLVALLAAAQAITLSGARNKLRNNPTAKDVMFVFFNGEAFDYIGSSRMVYEMEKNRFPHSVGDDGIYLHPINLTHISHFIELNQIGLGQGKVYIHTDPISRNITTIDTQINSLIELLNTIGPQVNLTAVEVGKTFPLPPASVQRFLMKRQQPFPSLVLTDHDKEFANRFYNSRFDLAREISASYPDHLNQSEWYDYVTPQAEQLTNVATMMARLLYMVATNGEDNFSENIVANKTTVANLLYCFLFDGACDLFQTVVDKANSLSDKPPSFYVSVDRSDNLVSGLTKRLLTYYLGEFINVTKDDCKVEDNDKFHTYYWIQGPKVGSERPGECYQSSVQFSKAKSPVFLDEMEDYDWLSGEYSTWTESVWGDFQVRLFLVPSKQFQTITLSVGVVIILVSMFVVYFINSNANIIFSDKPSNSYD